MVKTHEKLKGLDRPGGPLNLLRPPAGALRFNSLFAAITSFRGYNPTRRDEQDAGWVPDPEAPRLPRITWRR